MKAKHLLLDKFLQKCGHFTSVYWSKDWVKRELYYAQNCMEIILFFDKAIPQCAPQSHQGKPQMSIFCNYE